MQNPKLPKNSREADQSATWNMSPISNAFQLMLSGIKKRITKRKRQPEQNKTQYISGKARFTNLV